MQVNVCAITVRLEKSIAATSAPAEDFSEIPKGSSPVRLLVFRYTALSSLFPGTLPLDFQAVTWRGPLGMRRYCDF